MKKIGIILFVVTLGIGLVISNLFSFGSLSSKPLSFSFGIGKINGSGRTASEVREISNFHSIEVGGVFHVEITAQKDYSVEIEADDNLLPLIETKISNGILRIGTTERISSRNSIRLRISAPNIEGLDVSGASHVKAQNMNSEDLRIESSGASKLEISGQSKRVNIDVSGATKVEAENLTAEDASVHASGASYVSLRVLGELRTKASGASRIVYSGNPTNVDKRTRGASSVTEK